MCAAERPALQAIRVYCQRPGCSERTTLPTHYLADIDRRTGVASGPDADGQVHSLMLRIRGWAFGMDPEGVLYAVCPADADAHRMPATAENS